MGTFSINGQRVDREHLEATVRRAMSLYAAENWVDAREEFAELMAIAETLHGDADDRDYAESMREAAA